MNAKEVEKLLISKGACSEARKWAKGKTLAEIWDQCERVDWICWLLGRMEGKEGWPDRKAIALAACSFAELALPFIRVGEDRPRQAIDTARALLRGDATIQEVKIARAATYAAAANAVYDAAAAAANAAVAAVAAAAHAANTADVAAVAATYAAAYAANAAINAAAAARAAAYDAAAVVAYDAAAAAANAAVAADTSYAAANSASINIINRCIEIIRTQLRPQFI